MIGVKWEHWEIWDKSFFKKLSIFIINEDFLIQKGTKMLPFLKDRHEGGMSAPTENIKREPDEGSESFEMLDAIVEDMLEAVQKKDKKLLKGALEALVEHIQDQDQEQDSKETDF